MIQKLVNLFLQWNVGYGFPVIKFLIYDLSLAYLNLKLFLAVNLESEGELLLLASALLHLLVPHISYLNII